MIIEFMGLPGCGKTTLSKILDREGIATRITITSKEELLKNLAMRCFTHPFQSLFIALSILTSQSSFAVRRLLLINAFGYRLAKMNKAVQASRKNGKGVYVIDEGPVQNTLSIFDKVVPAKTLEKFFTRAKNGIDHIMCLDLSKNSFEMRVHNRGRIGREGTLSPQQITKWADVLYSNYQTLKTQVIPNTNVRYSIIDSNTNVQEVLGKIKMKINEINS